MEQCKASENSSLCEEWEDKDYYSTNVVPGCDIEASNEVEIENREGKERGIKPRARTKCTQHNAKFSGSCTAQRRRRYSAKKKAEW